MGRPSRKTTASTIMLQDSDGEMLFFSIDNHGNSSYVGNQNQILSNSNFQEIPIQDNKNLALNSIESNSKSSDEKYSNDNLQIVIPKEDNDEVSIKKSVFDKFIDQLNGNFEIDCFLKKNRVSNQMLPPITA